VTFLDEFGTSGREGGGIGWRKRRKVGREKWREDILFADIL
jgi:hypothetical protein